MLLDLPILACLPEDITNMPFYLELSDKVVKTLTTIASYTYEQLYHLSNTQALQQLLLFRDLASHLTTSSYPPPEIELSTFISLSEQQSPIPNHLCLYCGNYGHHAYICSNKPTIYTFIPTSSTLSQTLNKGDYSTSTFNYPNT